jgi:hypothetical protein
MKFREEKRQTVAAKFDTVIANGLRLRGLSLHA